MSSMSATEHIVYPEISWRPYRLGGKLRNMIGFFGVFPCYARPDEVHDCWLWVGCPECGDGDNLVSYSEDFDSPYYEETDVPETCLYCGAKLVVPREDDVPSDEYNHVRPENAIGFIVQYLQDWNLFFEPVPAFQIGGEPKYHLLHKSCEKLIPDNWVLVTNENFEEYNYDHSCFHYHRW